MQKNESTSPKSSRKISVGCLNSNIKFRRYLQNVWVKYAAYLRETFSVKMPFNEKTGKSKGFAFVTGPDPIPMEL